MVRRIVAVLLFCVATACGSPEETKREAEKAPPAGSATAPASVPASSAPSAERGRQIYVAQCGACHHPTDPGKPGSLAPEIKGAGRELIEARVVRGGYPPGYRPKRETKIMQPLPGLVSEVDSLAAFLRE
jgi:mono/diheme cytochrome c family protein